MRKTITHPGADELVYEIREIVEVAHQIEKEGQEIVWENIGDPVHKGEKLPEWIKDHVAEALKDDSVYAYSPTMGLIETRKYIARERNLEGGIQITPDDILFFNGLGDAISKLYRSLHPEARIIGPNPAYPTHSSAEAAHARGSHITYPLDPHNGWQPDIEQMEAEIKAHPVIVGILIVNPDNPTGIVFSDENMKAIVALAKKYNLFIISDEIYSNLVFDGVEYKKLAQYIGNVPAIAMRGVSKEFPWPGGRCGWVEFYNRDKDPDFDKFCKSLIDAKMLEVCSTTLPQRLIPTIMQDTRYLPFLKKRTSAYQARAKRASQILSDIPEIQVQEPQGAFYMTATFKEGVLNDEQSLPIEKSGVERVVSGLVNKDDALDKRFIYYLLGATGICLVPLQSGFNSTYHGFRFTLLEPDEEKFDRTIKTIKTALQHYLQSA
jgi:aspartate/methionine/tyrosine aminotransferase